MASSRDSPFCADEPCSLIMSVVPPSRCIADKKLQLVRVLGSRKAQAKSLPSST